MASNPMTRPKLIKIGMEAKSAIISGINIVANLVKSTLGPSGQYVVIDFEHMNPKTTNDGVTVAKSIFLTEQFANLGAKLIKEVASKTNQDSGDGTTTATLLAQCMIKEGMKAITANHDPIKIKDGIEVATKKVLAAIKKISRKIETQEDIKRIATISANNEDLGKLISAAYEKVGKDGLVMIEEGHKSETEIDLVEGMTFDRGFLSPWFINQPNYKVKYEDVNILIFDDKISNVYEISTLLQNVLATDKPLLIIANDIDGDAFNALVATRAQKGLPIVAVKSPWFGDRRKELLDDIAIVTGATILSKKLGHVFNKMDLSVLGKSRKIEVSKEQTIIITEQTEEIKVKLDNRIKQIRDNIDKYTSDYDKEKERERLAKLTGGLAIIQVGGKTESEALARKDKIEDAVNAVRSAIEEGIVPGGGYAYVYTLYSYDHKECSDFETKLGYDIVYNSIQEPAKQIAQNAGYSGDVVLNNMKQQGKLFNAKLNTYEDTDSSTVVDPAKTIRCALENAVSITTLLLITNGVMVAEVTEEN